MADKLKASLTQSRRTRLDQGYNDLVPPVEPIVPTHGRVSGSRSAISLRAVARCFVTNTTDMMRAQRESTRERG